MWTYPEYETVNGMMKSLCQKVAAKANAPLSNLSRTRRCPRVSVRATSSIPSSSQPASHSLLSLVGLKVLNVSKAFSAKAAQLSNVSESDAAAINGQIKESIRGMRMLAMVVPFAAVSGSTPTFLIITKAVASFIKLYLLLLFVRVLLSWFPTFTKWEEQPWLALRQVTDPYLKLFSGLVPPLMGTIDLTPLFGFFILQFLGGALDVTDDESKFWP